MVENYLKALFLAIIAGFGAWNLYRGFSGLSILFFLIRSRNGWYTIENSDPDIFGFFMVAWGAVAAVAGYLAGRQFLIALKGED